MSETTSGKTVFSQLEKQDPGIASAFRTFRQRKEKRTVHEDKPAAVEEGLTGAGKRYENAYDVEYDYKYRPVVKERALHRRRMLPLLIGFILLVVGIAAVAVAVVLGPAVARFVVTHWQAILLPTGGLCGGAGAVLLLSRLGSSALRNVDPPDKNTDDPLQELRDLAERTATRLRAAYCLQLWAVLGVGTVFIALIA